MDSTKAMLAGGTAARAERESEKSRLVLPQCRDVLALGDFTFLETFDLGDCGDALTCYGPVQPVGPVPVCAWSCSG